MTRVLVSSAFFVLVPMCAAFLAADAIAAAAPRASSYDLTLRQDSDAAAWTQTARAEIAAFHDSLGVTLRDVRLTIEQAQAEHRATIERVYGGYDGASAEVKTDGRGNILSVGDISSPGATDGRVPVSEAEIRRIVGLCILATPSTMDIAAISAGDSWPADYQSAPAHEPAWIFVEDGIRDRGCEE